MEVLAITVTCLMVTGFVDLFMSVNHFYMIWHLWTWWAASVTSSSQLKSMTLSFVPTHIIGFENPQGNGYQVFNCAFKVKLAVYLHPPLPHFVWKPGHRLGPERRLGLIYAVLPSFYLGIMEQMGFRCHGNFHIWVISWQNQQNGMCAQRRLRSAWASAQSDQSLRLHSMGSQGPKLSSCG